MVQLPGHMYPRYMSVVLVVVKWFVFLTGFGYKRKTVTSVSSEKVVVFSSSWRQMQGSDFLEGGPLCHILL